MKSKKSSLLSLVLLGVSAVFFLAVYVTNRQSSGSPYQSLIAKAGSTTGFTKALLPSPPPTPTPIFPYARPRIEINRSYLTFLVGDSMVASLGKNANQLRLDLITRYPGHEFVNYNYGFGSTNILTVPDRLFRQTTFLGEQFPPILEQTFDLIIFESFAYNPLSEFSLSEGLKKQTEILDFSVKSVISRRPKSVVAIMVPIAPSRKHFAKTVYKLSPEVRAQWVDERLAYIQNAIDFATANHIPLINVYEKSLTPEGVADLRYISTSDYIHPSKEGVRLISRVIADFIYQNSIFPQ